MRWMLRGARMHALIVIVVFSAFFAVPALASEIFKCVAKDGGPLYQNFPCYLDSLGAWASNPGALPPSPAALLSNSVAATTPFMPVAASLEKPKTASVGATAIFKSAGIGQLRSGMTEDEVKTLMGEPEEMIDDEPAEGGRVSLWRYADGRSVLFDHKHQVLEVQR